MLGKIRTALACTFMLSLAVQADMPARGGKSTSYVDPRFARVHSSTVSAIVTGDRASDAVARAGGTTVSDLWVINAVSAIIPTNAVARLAASPGIQSIVLNDSVRTADAGNGARAINQSTVLPEKTIAPAAPMPDGGFVTVDEKGTVAFYDRTGKIVKTVKLVSQSSGGDSNAPDATINDDDDSSTAAYTKAPVVLTDGTVIIASGANSLAAVSPSGTILWRKTIGYSTKIYGKAVQMPDGSLTLVNERGTVYNVNSATGAILRTSPTSTYGYIYASPEVDAAGTIYFGTSGGYIHAVSAAGAKVWSVFVSGKYTLKPLIGTDNTIFLASTDGQRLVALDSATGARRWTFTSIGKIRGNPVIVNNYALFGTDDGYVYCINPDGTQRWRFRSPGGKFLTSPVLSRDLKTAYLSQEQDVVFALDTSTGMERWRYALKGKITAPVLDVDNGIIVGAYDKSLVRLDAQGRATFNVLTEDHVLKAPVTTANADTLIQVGDHRMMAIGRLPETWDGRSDVAATSNPTVWDTVNPATVDTGANLVHETTDSNGKKVRGKDVTVAVVDSGIYFDKDVRANQGLLITSLYKGQADFASPGCENATSNNMGSCFRSLDNSIDQYGHGTAVSSIIWNNYTDLRSRSALGIAPDANVLSVRVMDENGSGTYENVIKGIQYVIDKRQDMNIRVMNLSMSSDADVPYFVDPINRAVEQAWASGIVVVASAGNVGPGAETISVPGNDPYIITVGAINTNRTPGVWKDDTLPSWSATGPSRDSFVKPDVLATGANVITFMSKNATNNALSQRMVQAHPDNSVNTSFFRMNGTSMSSPVVSGIVALMLQADPTLTPDQVKYRLTTTARPSTGVGGNSLTYNSLQQGAGRVWAPDAVWNKARGNGNPDMNIATDLMTGYDTDEELSAHYQGPVQKVLSDNGKIWLYYTIDSSGVEKWLGFAKAPTMQWLDMNDFSLTGTTWDTGTRKWASGVVWEGGKSTDTDDASYGAGRMSWGAGRMSWGAGRMSWGAGRMSWGAGRMSWGAGRMSWGASVSPNDPSAPPVWIPDN